MRCSPWRHTTRGLTNVDEWVAHAHAEGTQLSAEAIPFPRDARIRAARARAQAAYRATYPRELGIQ